MFQKICSKMHPVSYTNIHHDVTDLVNQIVVENTNTWISWEKNITFLWNKKILNLCLIWHILRSYRFVVEVTFKFLLVLWSSLIDWDFSIFSNYQVCKYAIIIRIDPSFMVCFNVKILGNEMWNIVAYFYG